MNKRWITFIVFGIMALTMPLITSANYQADIDVIDNKLPDLIDNLVNLEGREMVDTAQEINRLRAEKQAYLKAMEYIDSLPINNGSVINNNNYVDKYTPPAEYIPIYKMAAIKYNVDWEYLAAIHSIETNFSNLSVMVSDVGAIGHSQFMPCTWVGWSHPTCSGLGKGNISTNELTNLSIINRYGGYGVDGNGDGIADPWNIYDAVHATANYLNKSGFSRNVYNAIFNYNRADWYVNDVINRAENIKVGEF